MDPQSKVPQISTNSPPYCCIAMDNGVNLTQQVLLWVEVYHSWNHYAFLLNAWIDDPRRYGTARRAVKVPVFCNYSSGWEKRCGVEKKKKLVTLASHPTCWINWSVMCLFRTNRSKTQDSFSWLKTDDPVAAFTALDSSTQPPDSIN